jgi:hypothetical protein
MIFISTPGLRDVAQRTRTESAGAPQYRQGCGTYNCVSLAESKRSVAASPYNPAMHRARLLIVPLLLVSQVLAEDSAPKGRKNETIAKADSIFGQRYTPVAGKTIRLYDEQTETGPRDEVIYWHGSTYVIELIFAADETVARIVLLPEDLLHSDSWTDVPNVVELSPGEMQWLVASANVLRPLGIAHATDAPNFCFQSGKNLYCTDHYELAMVSHYHEQLGRNQSTENRLRDIAILYKQPVAGIVEDARVQESERHLKVDGQWYHGEKPGVEIFEKAQVGSVVHLITYGCTANKKACIAVPE